MKIYHFAILFILFFLAAVIETDINIGKLKSIENEKEELTKSLNSATSDAVNYISSTGSYGANSIKKEELLTTFFASLYSSMGIISDKSAQSEIEIYIPVILLCDIDGYYIYFYEEYKASDGNTYVKRKWTEKKPYSYEDEFFIYRFTLNEMVYIYDKNNIFKLEDRMLYVNHKEFINNPQYSELKTKYKDCILIDEEKFDLIRKTVISDTLEKELSYYTSKHNFIASKQGIEYTFMFPSNKDEWASYIDDVSLLVIFQGYPYGPGRNYRYNKIASAGANIIKKQRYYVEQRSWYNLAHRQGCEKITESTLLLDETFDSIEECVKLGAYCCECIEHGARVPELKK